MEPSPLSVPGFPRLAVSYAINELGDNLGVVALAILVLDGTGSALATAALFVAARFVPAFVAPALTARLDRGPVNRSLPAIYALEAMAFGGLALLAANGAWLPAVLALAAVDGTLALTGRGLSRGAVAALLNPHGALRRGNALINIAFAVTSAAGPIAGALLVASAGASTALAVDAVSFALIAVLLAVGRDLPRAAPQETQPWMQRVREGVSAVARQPLLRTLVVAQTIAFVFFFLVIPIEVVYAIETLDAGDVGYGALLGSWGVGLVIGSTAFARLRDRSTTALIVGATLLVGVGYLGLAAAPGIVLACAASVVGGSGNGVQWVSVLTAVQEALSDALQARVVGLLESIGAAAPGAGFLLGGALTALWSPRVAYLTAGVGVVAVAAVMARRLRDRAVVG
ncbi:MAG TPA: MFS transporter [Capillimicrobium sp.]|nr:MFS transporter [Capillimicrobium sp.]